MKTMKKKNNDSLETQTIISSQAQTSLRPEMVDGLVSYELRNDADTLISSLSVISSPDGIHNVLFSLVII